MRSLERPPGAAAELATNADVQRHYLGTGQGAVPAQGVSLLTAFSKNAWSS